MKTLIAASLLLVLYACQTQLPDLPYKSVLVGPGLARITGGWVFDDMGNQAQTTDIICDSSTGECNEATAILSHLVGTGDLSVDRVTYRIIEWREKSITAVADEYDCVRYTLSVNGVSGEVSKTRTLKSDSLNCSGITPALLVTLRGRGE